MWEANFPPIFGKISSTFKKYFPLWELVRSQFPANISSNYYLVKFQNIISSNSKCLWEANFPLIFSQISIWSNFKLLFLQIPNACEKPISCQYVVKFQNSISSNSKKIFSVLESGCLWEANFPPIFGQIFSTFKKYFSLWEFVRSQFPTNIW